MSRNELDVVPGGVVSEELERTEGFYDPEWCYGCRRTLGRLEVVGC